MLPIVKRVEVEVLSRAGHTELDIARLTGMPLRSIRRIEEESRIGRTANDLHQQGHRSGRLPEAKFRDLVADELRQNPRRSSGAILRRARAEAYRGSRTAMHGLIARIRSSICNPLATLGRLPGVLSRHELSVADVSFCNGPRTRVHFLVSRLEFSHWTVASLLPDGGIESLLRGLVDHYVRFEGVPAVAVFAASNGILEPSNLGAEPSSRFAFANAILELGICVRAGPVRKEVRPHGPAERVKRSFFESRDFASRQHMSDELAIWQNEINLQLATRSPRKVPATSIAEERAHLRPVNMDTDHFAIRMPVMIGAEAKVAYDGISYRVPTEMAHTLAALRLYRNRVIIIAGERVVEHERRPIWQ